MSAAEPGDASTASVSAAAVLRPERIGSASSSVSGAEISYAGGRVTSIDSRVDPRRSKPSAGWMIAFHPAASACAETKPRRNSASTAVEFGGSSSYSTWTSSSPPRVTSLSERRSVPLSASSPGVAATTSDGLATSAGTSVRTAYDGTSRRSVSGSAIEYVPNWPSAIVAVMPSRRVTSAAVSRGATSAFQP